MFRKKNVNHYRSIAIIEKDCDYFYTILVLLIILLIASFIRASKANNESKEAVNKTHEIQKKYEDNAETVQYNPNLKLYADKYIDAYMTIPKDGKAKEDRQKC